MCKRERSFIINILKKIAFGVFCYLAVSVFSIPAMADFSGPYELQNWVSASYSGGPLVMSIDPSSGSSSTAKFSYEASGYTYDYRLCSFSTTAASTGTITFNWNYWFFHSWYSVYADLYVYADGSTGRTTIQLVDFYNLSWTGAREFSGTASINVEQGYEFGLIVGGKNFDGSRILTGKVTVTDTDFNLKLPVDVDIKPQSCPNPLNIKSKGVLPVAILGTSDFDVNTIDVNSITLNGVAPVRSAYEDVAAPSVFEPCGCESLGPDTYEDLVLKFDTQAIIATLGEVEDGDEILLTLGGNLLEDAGGTEIGGSDCVLILDKGKAKGK